MEAGLIATVEKFHCCNMYMMHTHIFLSSHNSLLPFPLPSPFPPSSPFFFLPSLPLSSFLFHSTPSPPPFSTTKQTYYGADGIDIDSITDYTQQEAMRAMVKTYGQMPLQLFREPHPPRSKSPVLTTFRMRIGFALRRFTTNSPLVKVGEKFPGASQTNTVHINTQARFSLVLDLSGCFLTLVQLQVAS